MLKNIMLWISLVLLISTITGIAYAQNNGSIRGTVYMDTNEDGQCSNTGEPTLSGTPIKFLAADGDTEIFLASGDDGTYGLVNAGLGTWTVSAEPSTNNMMVTSQNPVSVFLSADQPMVTGVDFCVAQTGVTQTVTPSPTMTPPPAATLPESGATIAPVLLIALSIGTVFILSGTILELKRRLRQ